MLGVNVSDVMACERARTGNYGEDDSYDCYIVCPWCDAEDPAKIYVDKQGVVMGCIECITTYDLKNAMEKFPHLIERREYKW